MTSVTISEAREACYQRFIDNWTATPLVDTTFAQEVGFVPPPKRLWARLTVRNTGSGGQTLGATGFRRFTRLGFVFIQVFGPLSDDQDGEGQLDPLIQDALKIFESVSFSGLRFFQGTPRETGDDDGKWVTAIVELPFDYDETK